MRAARRHQSVEDRSMKHLAFGIGSLAWVCAGCLANDRVLGDLDGGAAGGSYAGSAGAGSGGTAAGSGGIAGIGASSGSGGAVGGSAGSAGSTCFSPLVNPEAAFEPGARGCGCEAIAFCVELSDSTGPHLYSFDCGPDPSGQGFGVFAVVPDGICTFPCGAGLVRGTQCGACGPADGCAVTISACMTPCSPDGTCTGGTCRNGLCDTSPQCG
jgi:hypothetical protein